MCGPVLSRCTTAPALTAKRQTATILARLGLANDHRRLYLSLICGGDVYGLRGRDGAAELTFGQPIRELATDLHTILACAASARIRRIECAIFPSRSRQTLA